MNELINTFFHEGFNADAGEIQTQATRGGVVSSYSDVSIMSDRYGGCHIVFGKNCGLSGDTLQKVRKAVGGLEASINESQEADSLWLEFEYPFKLSMIPQEWEVGVKGQCELIHDQKSNRMRIWKWLNPKKECKIPPGATHNIGAQALVVDNIARKVLLIVDNRQNDRWCLPGGSFDPEKDKPDNLATTAAREVEEETGIKIPEKSIKKALQVGQIAFPNYQFAPALNQTFAFNVPNGSKQALKRDLDEIATAEWFDIDRVLKAEKELDDRKIGKETTLGLNAALKGLGLKIVTKNKFVTIRTAGHS